MTAARLLFIVLAVFYLLCVESRLILNLNYAQWKVSPSDGGFTVDANVPGGIYSDLKKANYLKEDLFYRFNDQKYRWVGYKNWTYSTNFEVPSGENLASPVLVFQGIDTISEIWLNGQLLGNTSNMFTAYRFPVATAIKKDGMNTLEVRIHSPVEEAKKAAMTLAHDIPVDCWPSDYNGECHINLLRKMQASFAWDWGPAFPSAGIWKGVTLENTDDPVLMGATVQVQTYGTLWTVQLTAWLESKSSNILTSDSNKGILAARLHAEGDSVFQTSALVSAEPANSTPGLLSASLSFNISKENVREWWPNGYGSQPLYPLEVGWVTDTDVQISTISIGFRTIELVQQPVNPNNLAQGLTFYFVVNGVELFAKGSNWIPLDILPEKSADKERMSWLLESAKDANFNMLRVWGGGLYESDEFYKKCDELGILIWQDLMFACNMYPAGQEFLNSVRKEMYQQVARLQHHPSIALWAGNNENEVALRQNWYHTESNFKVFQQEYIKLYVDTIRPIFTGMDPSRPFIVSSPSNGPLSEQQNYIAANPQSSLYGDVHYYNYIGDLWNPDVYPKPRFASEYGVQSLPSESTLSQVATTADLKLGSQWWTARQHQPAGWGYMEAQLAFNFPTYNTTTQAIYYSQINQAVSIQTETEHYRRMKNTLFKNGEGKTMGALYWQLNDVWQAPSWSSIEYTGKWKILHYYAKKFLAPIIISPYITSDKLISVWAVSDSSDDITDGILNIFLRSVYNFVPVQVKRRNVKLLSNTAAEVYKDDLASMLKDCPKPEECFFHLTFTTVQQGRIAPDSYVLPTKVKDMSLPRANVSIAGWQRTGPKSVEIKIITDAPALFVWLDPGSAPGVFNDNGFHMTESLIHVTFRFRQSPSVSDIMSLLMKLVIHHAASFQ